LKYRTFSVLEFEREKLRQLFDTERMESYRKVLKEAMRIHPIFFIDVQ